MKRTEKVNLLVISVLAIIFLSLNPINGQSLLENHNADPNLKINSQNVNNLKVLWTTTFKEYITHKPLIQKNRVYFGDWGGTVYAADANSGKIIWEKKLQAVDSTWAWHGFPGTGALGKDMLFEASAEGNLFAIDIKNGDVKWKTRFTDKPFAGNIGTLLYYNNLVYVPVSSMDEGMDQQKGFITDFQGNVEAFDATTGKRIWQFKTVPDSANGAAVWGGFALDPATKTLYFGTGNNYTGKATEMSDAIIAVDAITGKLKWAKQCTEKDLWTVAQPKNGPDYDFGTAPQFFEAKIDEKERKLVGAAQKSGVFWVLDRLTGDLVWKVQLGAGAAGGGFMGMVSIDKSGIYAWSNNSYTYTEPLLYPMDIASFEPATGRELWKKTKAQPAWLTETGFAAWDLYFVGSLDGKIRAYNTQTGDLAWTSDQMGSISTSIMGVGNKLYFGTGIPKMFSGIGEGGTLYCIGLTK